MDYGHPLRFGIFPVPRADSAQDLIRLARHADDAGFDLLGIQDHPYQRNFLDTWALMGWILAQTQRIGVFPDVANLPLRPARMLAKAAASLDLLSGGRFELGLGAGASADGVAAMGGAALSPREAVDALESAIPQIREHWRAEGKFEGPSPAHDIGIWLGAYKPRMLRITGALADGWVPSLGYLPPEDVPGAMARVDEAAREAGRDPADIRRVYNLREGAEWEDVAGYATELGFDTFIFSAEDDIDRLAGEVIPAVREAVTRRRTLD
jgi:alkanesulfonate monooxygenase SsuD/methylene tetrahydromethanopterin reductase-like flavin-dependent oxidoreductase (luciferase family)